ncbi:hypothetical protein ABZ863_22960 [Saccharomonospora sp. NPDC046836]|uniref:hypothetical protein n=1 Tax=Saccharomonospora sp. NPDC046836 TaxID=3156921 RepID=UPI003409085D
MGTVPPASAPLPPGYSLGGDPAIGVPELGLPPDGIAFQYDVDGVPRFGILGADGQNTALLNAQRAAGSAVALPAGTDTLRQPLTLAILLITLVSTQLLRRWLTVRTRVKGGAG